MSKTHCACGTAFSFDVDRLGRVIERCDECLARGRKLTMVGVARRIGVLASTGPLPGSQRPAHRMTVDEHNRRARLRRRRKYSDELLRTLAQDEDDPDADALEVLRERAR